MWRSSNPNPNPKPNRAVVAQRMYVAAEPNSLRLVRPIQEILQLLQTGVLVCVCGCACVCVCVCVCVWCVCVCVVCVTLCVW